MSVSRGFRYICVFVSDTKGRPAEPGEPGNRRVERTSTPRGRLNHGVGACGAIVTFLYLCLTPEIAA
jgi:hypothetical protein